MKQIKIVGCGGKAIIEIVPTYAGYSVVDEAEKVAEFLQGVIPSSVFEEVKKYLQASKKNKSVFQGTFRKEYFDTLRLQQENEDD